MNTLSCPICNSIPVTNRIHNEFVTECPACNVISQVENLLDEHCIDECDAFNIAYSKEESEKHWNLLVLTYQYYQDFESVAA